MKPIDKYHPGMIVYGQISGLKPYGAFVNFADGLSGLIHISELSNGFVRNIGKIVKVDDYVLCKVIDVDEEHNQLRLSYKALKRNRRDHRLKVNFLGMPLNKIGFSSIEAKMPEWIKEKENA